jgi:D-alanine-D-alanine ligase
LRARRVLALVPEGKQPPEQLEDVSQEQVSIIKMEYDVITSLRGLGHEVQILDVGYDLTPIREAVAGWEPHIVFNMLEEFHGHATFDQNVVAYLELLQMAYTGCNPRGLVIARDKALTKKILAYHRIPTPRFQVVPRRRAGRKAARLEYPLFVKSLIEDASAGISQGSIVHNDEQLRKRVAYVHEQTHDEALVEEYIDGRELYLGIIGNSRLTTFPLWELVMEGLPDGTAPIATRTMKFDMEYQERYGVTSRLATDLPEGLAERVAHIGKRIYRALGLTGYARVDLRLAPDGRVYVLEANPNPDLSLDEDFALSAEASGLDYDKLIGRIVSLGLRYHSGRA